MAQFTMSLAQQQEQFSLAFIRAIAAVAGYSVEEVNVDIDSIDLTIMQYGNNESYPEIEGLRVQLKCTYRHVPDSGRGCIAFPLSLKNYNDLRRKGVNPRILVVVHVPGDVNSWMTEADDCLTLYHAAYWVSLRGRDAVDNIDNITVEVPLAQKFTVAALKQIMNLIANGERP